jgi:hypothetical protein
MAAGRGSSSDNSGKESLPTLLSIDPYDTRNMPPTKEEFSGWSLINQLQWLYGKNMIAFVFLTRNKNNMELIIEAVVDDLFHNINNNCQKYIQYLLDNEISKELIVRNLLFNLYGKLLFEAKQQHSPIMSVFQQFTNESLTQLIEWILSESSIILLRNQFNDPSQTQQETLDLQLEEDDDDEDQNAQMINDLEQPDNI